MIWGDILKEINSNYFNQQTEETLSVIVSRGLLEEKYKENKWLGNDPCTIEQIEILENKLGAKLPISYKDFLLISNGFKNIAPMMGNINPIEKVNWLKETDQEWLEIINQFNYDVSDDKYFDYTENQQSPNFRNEYLKDCLKISDWEDGVIILLNPIIKYESEWEVIEYGTWFPGAKRYRSFLEYMIAKKNSDPTLW